MFRPIFQAVLRPTAVENGATTVRSMATLKEIATRLKSVTSIRKITKSMKMVSAAKFARAERNLKASRATGPASGALLEKLNIDLESESEKQIYVVMSSDRGLCGGIHSGVARHVKGLLAKKPANVDVQLVCIGDKARSILQRVYQDKLLITGNSVGRTAPLFIEASFVAQELLRTGYPFTSGKIIYNQFKSAVAYVIRERPILSAQAIEGKEALNLYDDVDSASLQSYAEFALASNMYFTMLESQASEQSARMSAMDNATNNASDMISSLRQRFNRTRQSVITTELIEIISGASAME